MHILFDLDGTLTNPFTGITQCIQHALAELDRPVPAAETLRWCIGPPLHESFMILLDTDDNALTETAVEKYRERFSTVGLFENEIFDGIHNLLANLAEQGLSMSVATSKPTVYAKRIIEHFDLVPYFQTIDGAELDGTRADKTSLIAHILQRDQLKPADVIMIGDRKHDIIGAYENGVTGLGVLWGFGSREELEAAGAVACVESPEDIEAAILGFTIQ